MRLPAGQPDPKQRDDNPLATIIGLRWQDELMRRPLAIVAAVIFVASACTSDERSTSPSPTEVTIETTDAPDATASVTSPPTTPSTTTQVVSSTTTSATITVAATTTSTTVPASPGIVRPIVAPAICEPTSRWGGEFTDTTWNLFARSSTGAISVQIIGDPEHGPTGPYAMLLRYVDRRAGVEGRETEPIGAFNVALEEVPNGNAHAFWNLDDGGEGYLRTRGLNRGTVVGIIESLTVRGDGDPQPGFDYLPEGESADIQLLHEGSWGNYSGSGAGIECVSPDGQARYRISATNEVDDPIVEYAFVSDRPAPIDVGYQQGSLIIIDGFGGHPDAPTVGDVHNADETTWAAIPASD